MLKSLSVKGPTLDNYGQALPISFDDFAEIKTDFPERLITGTATGGAGVIPMTNTSGFAVGQIITIQDSAASEVRTISVVTPGVSLTVGVNLTNTYTVARGGRVTVTNYGAYRVSAVISNPFTATLTLGAAWLAGIPIRVYGTLSAGFTQGELVTGTSGATGRLIGQGSGYIDVLPVSGTFVLTDTFTGGTSASTVTAVTSFTPLAPAVLVTVEKVTVGGGPALAWAVAVTADVAAQTLTVIADVD
jgi:hypothetical protein